MGKLSAIVKSVGDYVIVLIGAIPALLVGMVIALVIKLTSRGPALFCQERAGKAMHPFTLYKFRTMRTNVDPFGPSPKAGDDPRLTTIGKWLRLTSLDELPQLINVVKGEMSLVGPRPLYMEQAKEWSPRQRRRLEVKPGLTGLAQVSGRGSLTIEEKLELDARYVESQSLRLDVVILARTVMQVLLPKDIYEKRYSTEQLTRRSDNGDSSHAEQR